MRSRAADGLHTQFTNGKEMVGDRMRRKPPMSLKEARETLEQLRDDTFAADPLKAAPPYWIAEMHRALRAIAPQEEVQRRRLDGLPGINMAYLHKRVLTILNDFDQIVAENPRYSVPTFDERQGNRIR
jgi:hypothetical protein